MSSWNSLKKDAFQLGDGVIAQNPSQKRGGIESNTEGSPSNRGFLKRAGAVLWKQHSSAQEAGDTHPVMLL